MSLVLDGAVTARKRSGFVAAGGRASGHPAVITVACVLVLSRGLYVGGAVDVIAERVLPSSAGPTATVAAHAHPPWFSAAWSARSTVLISFD